MGLLEEVLSSLSDGRMVRSDMLSAGLVGGIMEEEGRVQIEGRYFFSGPIPTLGCEASGDERGSRQEGDQDRTVADNMAQLVSDDGIGDRGRARGA